MRQSYKAREKTLKEEIENNFRAQIVNLTREKEEQKEANKHNNASSLSKINLQEKTIQVLFEEVNYYKDKLEETNQGNN